MLAIIAAALLFAPMFEILVQAQTIGKDSISLLLALEASMSY